MVVPIPGWGECREMPDEITCWWHPTWDYPEGVWTKRTRHISAQSHAQNSTPHGRILGSNDQHHEWYLPVIGQNLCILLQVSHYRDVTYKLRLYITAHLWEPDFPGNEHKIPLFSSQETSWPGPPAGRKKWTHPLRGWPEQGNIWLYCLPF